MMRYAEVPWPWAGLTIALVLLALLISYSMLIVILRQWLLSKD